MKKKLLIFFLIFPLLLSGQDIDELLNIESVQEDTYEIAAFKATRVINGHSIAQREARHLDFRISHRFGEVNEGIRELFGLDQAFIHFSLEYGFSDWLMAGAGRSNVQKTYDAFIKTKILQQTANSNRIPFFISYLGSAEVFTTKWVHTERDNKFGSRLTYVHQLLIARKFNKNLSLQLSPTLIHKNLTPTKTDQNDLFALGFSGRYKISNRVSLNAEYYHAFRSNDSTQDFPNSLSFGVDIETGGHVFQIMLTNAQSMREGGFIWGETNGDWTDGGIHLGFNISRIFSFEKP